MKIRTQNIKNKFNKTRWHSYATFNGYDYSESGDTIEESQTNIREKLESVGARFEDMRFLYPTLNYETQDEILKPKAVIGYANHRIDNL